MPAFNHNQLLAIAAVVAVLGLASEEAFAPDAAAMGCTAAPQEAAAALPELDPTQRVLAEHLSRRFYVALGATELMVATAYRAAGEVGLDPLTVLAVISIESRFNPIAESSMGAKGLMQIIPRYHRAKLDAQGGEDAVLDPESNILVGTRILQEYVYRSGTLEAGLQLYNGAARDNTAGYSQKVLAERARLEQVLRGTPVAVLASRGG